MLLGQIEMPDQQGAPAGVAGSISGVVVNACQDNRPVAGAEVVLRVLLDGQFVVAAETTADERGHFRFEPIPADEDYVYLPGANHDGVHYPAARIRLQPQLPHAQVQLPVHETVADPNPLVLRDHHVSIRSEHNAIHVTETLEIENPTLKTYVGRAKQAGGRAATLRLAIPDNFRRVTFDQEFYGRQFTVIENQLVTDIPWTPGRRTLKLSYVLPADSSPRSWQRLLDLPCRSLRIDVHTNKPDAVSCAYSDDKRRTKRPSPLHPTERASSQISGSP